MLNVESFFDLTDCTDTDLFTPGDLPWQPLDRLKNYMDDYQYPDYNELYREAATPLAKHLIIHDNQILPSDDCQILFGDATKQQLQVRRGETILTGASVIMAGAIIVGKQLALGKGVLIEASAMLKTPAIIGDYTEVRQGAYLRGYCLAGKRCVLGHTTEIKHSILFDDAKAGHFAYVGDSILGHDTNLGAGTKLANLRFLAGNVQIRYNGERLNTGRRKLGAILGDGCQTGCNAVTNPGTILGPESLLSANTTAKPGIYPQKTRLR
ncbi:MAG: hypothetical protein CSA20_01205 [Deltaproteobacteria bacterium]|nr:MAG: hypothetical protein CSB32_00110 [Desulfobacterales bacterium]PIE73808.1 MAG: hypothetical protein CSA20_01205 [Deltaproteobacteria bacterium]